MTNVCVCGNQIQEIYNENQMRTWKWFDILKGCRRLPRSWFHTKTPSSSAAKPKWPHFKTVTCVPKLLSFFELREDQEAPPSLHSLGDSCLWTTMNTGTCAWPVLCSVSNLPRPSPPPPAHAHGPLLCSVSNPPRPSPPLPALFYLNSACRRGNGF